MASEHLLGSRSIASLLYLYLDICNVSKSCCIVLCGNPTHRILCVIYILKEFCCFFNGTRARQKHAYTHSRKETLITSFALRMWSLNSMAPKRENPSNQALFRALRLQQRTEVEGTDSESHFVRRSLHHNLTVTMLCLHGSLLCRLSICQDIWVCVYWRGRLFYILTIMAIWEGFVSLSWKDRWLLLLLNQNWDLEVMGWYGQPVLRCDRVLGLQ